MTLDELITQLKNIKEQFGGNIEIAVNNNAGELDHATEVRIDVINYIGKNVQVLAINT
jgi:hypothetical protein